MRSIHMLTAVLILLGFCYQGHAQVVDTLVDVGTYRLHFNIVHGKGSPILFEAGSGDDGTIWSDLIKPLRDSTGTTLITYDRQGFGKSELDSTKVDILNEVMGLEIALNRLGYNHDLLLVSHSFGGSYSTLYASRQSKHVIGAVFIDITLPCFYTREKTREIKGSFSDKLASLKTEDPGVYHLLSNYEESNDYMRTITFPSQIPVADIVADHPPFEGAEGEKWKACHKQFVGNVPNRQLIIAEDCGHYIFKDNPQLVIHAIVEMYRRKGTIKKPH